MADTVIDVHQHGAAGHDDHHHDQNWIVKYLWSTDHKIIAMQYMFTGMAMGVIGGYMAYVFRMQLAFPGISVPGFGQVSPGEYNALITNHGSIMIFWLAMPVLIAAFGNYLIPQVVYQADVRLETHDGFLDLILKAAHSGVGEALRNKAKQLFIGVQWDMGLQDGGWRLQSQAERSITQPLVPMTDAAVIQIKRLTSRH